MTQFVQALDCAAVEVEVPNDVAALQVALTAEKADKANLLVCVHRMAQEALTALESCDYGVARGMLKHLVAIE